jgi:hypothetical protein
MVIELKDTYHFTTPIKDKSDISQDFRLADILGIPQAIKGFDKPDFCEVFSIYLLQGGNYD